MRGRNGEIEQRGREDGERRGAFGADSPFGIKLCEAHPHGADDPPAAEQGSEPHRAVGCPQDPCGNIKRGQRACRHESACNDTCCFLGVVAAMHEAEKRRGEELKFFVDGIAWREVGVGFQKTKPAHYKVGESKTHDGRDDNKGENAAPPAYEKGVAERSPAVLQGVVRHCRAGIAAQKRVGGAAGQAEPPCCDSPQGCAREAAQNNDGGNGIERDEPCPHRFGDACAEKKRGGDIEKRRPQNGLARSQHTRRHDCGDGIGGIVEAVDKIERQSRRDDADNQN